MHLPRIQVVGIQVGTYLGVAVHKETLESDPVTCQLTQLAGCMLSIALSLSLNAPPIQPDTARNAAKFYGLKFYYILLHTCSCYYGRILSSTGSECVAPSCNPSLYLHPRAVPNGHSIFHSVDINEQALDVNRFASHVGSS